MPTFTTSGKSSEWLNQLSITNILRESWFQFLITLLRRNVHDLFLSIIITCWNGICRSLWSLLALMTSQCSLKSSGHLTCLSPLLSHQQKPCFEIGNGIISPNPNQLNWSQISKLWRTRLFRFCLRISFSSRARIGFLKGVSQNRLITRSHEPRTLLWVRAFVVKQEHWC